MDVPIDLSIALSFFAFLAGGLVGIALRRKDEVAAVPDLKPQVVAMAELVRRYEEPRLISWTPETVAKFRYQQEASRQLIAARRVA